MRQLIAELLWYIVFTGCFYYLFSALLNWVTKKKIKESTVAIASLTIAICVVTSFVRITII